LGVFRGNLREAHLNHISKEQKEEGLAGCVYYRISEIMEIPPQIAIGTSRRWKVRRRWSWREASVTD
jgi:hypothetical protein